MCGIAGIYGSLASEENIGLMLNKQKHRGPDYTGIWKKDTLVLGHNRLSIIDLNTASNQPMVSNCGNYILVFNGEIYNYIELKKELIHYNFKTKSDSEVLLAAYIHWGIDCLDKLNGMFSFVIWDEKSQILIGARDRFGVKPLYYSQFENNLIFASEIKSIHAITKCKKVNSKVWASFLCYGSYGDLSETFWEDIFQIPGGHAFVFQNNSFEMSKWYDFEKDVATYKGNYTYEEVKQQYYDLLLDSIRLRFRADVPVGFNVSGGLDSSALLALVNLTNHKNINAFTFYTNDERYDELPWVTEMLAITQNPLEKVLLNVSEIPYLADYISKIQDEPYGGIPTLAYSNIFKEARAKGILVLLDGQGMDEQWAGYDYYLKNDNAIIQGTSKSPFKEHVLQENFKNLAIKPTYPKPFQSDLLNMQYRDLFYTKIPRVLRFNDRISMAYSTELREPFLDYRLVAFAFAQPDAFKIKEGIQKYLVRDLVSEHLASNIVYAPKRPLQTPQREWLANELQTWVIAKIKILKQSKVKDWFNFDQLELEWSKYVAGDIEVSFHIWQWVNLAILISDES